MSARTVEIKSYPPCPMGDGEAPAQAEVTLIDEGFGIKHQLKPITGKGRTDEAVIIAREWLRADIFKPAESKVFGLLDERDALELRKKCNDAVKKLLAGEQG